MQAKIRTSNTDQDEKQATLSCRRRGSAHKQGWITCRWSTPGAAWIRWWILSRSRLKNMNLGNGRSAGLSSESGTRHWIECRLGALLQPPKSSQRAGWRRARSRATWLLSFMAGSFYLNASALGKKTEPGTADPQLRREPARMGRKASKGAGGQALQAFQAHYRAMGEVAE